MSNPPTNAPSFSPSSNDTQNDVKSILIATIPKVPALLSITCSSLIIQKIVRSPTRRKNIFHRIMLGLSISDVCSSLVYFLGTWLVPKGSMTVGGYGPVYWAAGTTDTCHLSGFFTQAAMAGPFYNATLACYYLLTIYYNWQDSRLKTVQHWFHILPIGWALMTSVIALALKMYGNVDWLCWILPDDRENGTLAQRSFVVFQWVFLFAPLWCCIFFVSGVMFLLWKKMRENERKMEKYRFTARASTSLDSFTENNATSVPKRGMNGWKKSSSEVLEKNDDSASTSLTKSMAPMASSDWRALRNKGVVVVQTHTSASSSIITISDTLGESMTGNDDLSTSVISSTAKTAQAASSFVNDEHDGEDTGMTIYEFLSSSSTSKRISSAMCKTDPSSPPKSNDQEDIRNWNGIHVEPSSGSNNSTDDLDIERGHSQIEMELDTIVSGRNQNTSLLQRAASRWSYRLRETSQRRQNEVTGTASAVSSRRLQLYNKASRSRQIAFQGMLYLCAFYVTWLFPTIKRLLELGHKNSFVIQFLDSTLLPLQGLFNFVIYMRPRLTAYRKVNKDIGFCRSMWNIVWEK